MIQNNYFIGLMLKTHLKKYKIMSTNQKMLQFLKKYGSLDIALESVQDIIEELNLIYHVEKIQNEYIANRINFYMDIENLIYENMDKNGYSIKIKK